VYHRSVSRSAWLGVGLLLCLWAVPRSVVAQAEGARAEAAQADGAQPEGAAEPGAETPVEGRHCVGQARPAWVLHQLLVAQINPGGVENSMRAGLCLPLFTEPHILLAYSSLEVGAISYLSPAYKELGGYLQVTPVSPLQLRAELGGVVIWPFPFPRAGYFGLSGYDADFQSDALPKGEARSATGWNLNLIAILRFRAPRNSAIQVFGFSMLSAERWVIGDQGFYFNLRRDLPLARADWVVANEALLGFELPFSGELRIRIGAFDSFRHVPAADYTGNQVGIFAMLWHPAPTGALRDLSPFLRLGIHTHHAFRAGTPALLAGTFVSYDLGGL